MSANEFEPDYKAMYEQQLAIYKLSLQTIERLENELSLWHKLAKGVNDFIEERKRERCAE